MNSFIKTTRKCRKGFHHNKSSGTCSRTLKLDRDSHRLEKIIKSPAFKKKVKDLIEKPVPKEAFKEYFNGEMAGGNSVSSTDEKHILSKIKDNLMSIINAIKIRLLTGVPPDVPQELAEEIISSPTKSLSIKAPASIKSMTIMSMSPAKSMSYIKSIKSIRSLPKSVKSSLTKSFNSIKSHLDDDEVEDLYVEEYSNYQVLMEGLLDTLIKTIVYTFIIEDVMSLNNLSNLFGINMFGITVNINPVTIIRHLIYKLKDFAGELNIIPYVNSIIEYCKILKYLKYH